MSFLIICFDYLALDSGIKDEQKKFFPETPSNTCGHCLIFSAGLALMKNLVKFSKILTIIRKFI